MKTLLHLEARKKKALARFLRYMTKNRAQEVGDLPDTPEEAFVVGLRQGYGHGLLEGFGLGFEVLEESEGSFDAPEVGSA